MRLATFSTLLGLTPLFLGACALAPDDAAVEGQSEDALSASEAKLVGSYFGDPQSQAGFANLELRADGTFESTSGRWPSQPFVRKGTFAVSTDGMSLRLVTPYQTTSYGLRAVASVPFAPGLAGVTLELSSTGAGLTLARRGPPNEVVGKVAYGQTTDAWYASGPNLPSVGLPLNAVTFEATQGDELVVSVEGLDATVRAGVVSPGQLRANTSWKDATPTWLRRSTMPGRPTNAMSTFVSGTVRAASTGTHYVVFSAQPQDKPANVRVSVARAGELPAVALPPGGVVKGIWYDLVDGTSRPSTEALAVTSSGGTSLLRLRNAPCVSDSSILDFRLTADETGAWAGAQLENNMVHSRFGWASIRANADGSSSFHIETNDDMWGRNWTYTRGGRCSAVFWGTFSPAP